jgi:hypothetical protein
MISDGPEVSIRRPEVGLQLLNCRCSGGGKRLNTRPIGLGQISSPIAEGQTRSWLLLNTTSIIAAAAAVRWRSAGLAANAQKSMAPRFDARKTSENHYC